MPLDVGRLPGGDHLRTALLATGADRRLLLADLAFTLHESQVCHVPHICHLSTRPAKARVPLPAFPLPDDLPMVSVLIPTRDGWPLLFRCLTSLEPTDWPRELLGIIIIDNGSTDSNCLAGLSALKAGGRIRLLRHDEKFNYARINNIAARQARGELLVLLNNDTEALLPDWLRLMAL